jgi:peptidoglycan hydrolase-like protein with peptidoglycan-binding domain
MLTNIRRCLVAALLAVPGITAAQDAQAILDKARDMQLERWEGVNCYAVTRSLMGQQATTYFERVEVVVDSGETETVFVPRPDMCEITAAPGDETMMSAGSGQAQPRKMTPEEMEAYADGLDMVGGAMSNETEHGMEEAGLPPGLLKSLGAGAEGPWVSPDPATMMGGAAGFMRAGAQGQREMAAERQETTLTMAREQANFRETARLAGTETIEGRKAYHLRTDGLNQPQEIDDGEFIMHSVDLWLDTKEYVPLKMAMSGTLKQGREARPVSMENYISDYRHVPGSKMYESYRQKMSIVGIMDEEQKAEMAEAQKQLEEMEAQLASMSPEQRAMVENMMAGQLDTVRGMAQSGNYESETVITDIRINPALTARNAPPPAVDPMPAQAARPSQPNAPAAGGDAVLKMVQENLTSLGYSTGNTDGVPSTETTIAISQFQAERGMEVTGTASPQLAGILAAEAGRQKGGGAQASRSPDELQAAREACLQEKMEAAQAAQQKKRGFRRLASAVSRTALGSGDYDLARRTQDVYDASATAEDLSAAAKDLGLTEDDIEACENPP